jgi:ubiquinone/menaquinone biosynthesis C-methylase UbiE
MTRLTGHDATRAVWGASPAGSTFGGGAQPGSREFFERVVRKRSTYEMPWLFEVVPFASFRGRRVVELGCGAGYDAYELCRQGAHYTGIDITSRNAELTRRHLAHYGFQPAVQVADAERLPFDEGVFDVVFSNGVLHHTPDISGSFREAHRVLRRGGEFWVILYHKHSIVHWLTLYFAEHILRLGFLRRSFRERLAMVEYTTSRELPLVNVYTRGEVRSLFREAGFRSQGVWVRKLVHEDLPGIPLLAQLWPAVLQHWLETLGRRWGWYLIARGVKD